MDEIKVPDRISPDEGIRPPGYPWGGVGGLRLGPDIRAARSLSGRIDAHPDTGSRIPTAEGGGPSTPGVASA